MTGKKFVLVILLVSMLVIGQAAQAYRITEAGNIILKLAHCLPVGAPTDILAHHWKDMVEEKTNGAVQVEIYPAEQLGSEKELLTGIQLGTIDCDLTDAAQVAKVWPPYGILDFPFLWRDMDHYKSVVFGPIFEELQTGTIENTKIHPLIVQFYGKRHLLTKKPILEAEDVKGLKLRTPEAELCMDWVRVLGGVPTPIAFTEAYMAIKLGVADGGENPLSVFLDMKWYEVGNYICLTSHVYCSQTLIMSEKAWNVLTPEQQEIVQEAAEKIGREAIELKQRMADKRLAELTDKGVTFTILPRDEIEKFRENATRLAREKYAKKYEQSNWYEWYQRIKEAGK